MFTLSVMHILIRYVSIFISPDRHPVPNPDPECARPPTTIHAILMGQGEVKYLRCQLLDAKRVQHCGQTRQ